MIVTIAVIIDTRVAATHHHHVVGTVNGDETASVIVAVVIDPKSHVTRIDHDLDAGIDRNGFSIIFYSTHQNSLNFGRFEAKNQF